MKKAVLFKKEKEERVRCLACSHKCLIDKNKVGICGVRKNLKGELYLLVYGKVVAANIDPIEKKPLYHFMPGSYSFSIGTVGCNFRCPYCQNYDISQEREILGRDFPPEEIVEEALRTGCKSISYTYNEPTIFIEFVKDTAEISKKRGLKNVMVTNGYMSKESFDFVADYIDAMNIDLKGDERFYREYCKAKQKPVLETIKRVYKKGIHLEITTLIIPEMNDSEKVLKEIAKFIANLNPEIPWHVTRFFPMYKVKDKEITPISKLKLAKEIGKKVGLKYIYLGNV